MNTAQPVHASHDVGIDGACQNCSYRSGLLNQTCLRSKDTARICLWMGWHFHVITFDDVLAVQNKLTPELSRQYEAAIFEKYRTRMREPESTKRFYAEALLGLSVLDRVAVLGPLLEDVWKSAHVSQVY